MNITLENVLETFKRKSYELKTGTYQLNIFGVRANTQANNKFDDLVGVIYKDYGNVWNLRLYEATTDPGFYFLENPANVHGTAILMEGQHKNSHRIGFHKNQYRALVQNKPLPVWRDNNRDHVYNFDPSVVDTGLFGINIHHAGAHSENVNNWSAGCQVLAILTEFEDLMELIDLNVENKWGEVFTYTLFSEKDFA